MNAIVYKLALFWLSKYKQPSTWIPFVSAAGAYLHFNITPDMQTAVDGIFAAIIGALFVAIQEHQTKPAPGSITAAVAGRVQQSASGPSGTDVSQRTGLQTGSRTDLRPPVVDDGSAFHPPIRPGFNRNP